MTTGTVFWDDVKWLTAARVALAASDFGAAYDRTAHVLDGARADQRRLGQAEALILRAVAAKALGRENESVQATEEALSMTAPEHRVSIWREMGRDAVPLLERAVLQQRVPAECIAHAVSLLSLLREESKAADDNGTLSDRETSILRLLAAGHTNQQIGDVLFLALGTVKKHTHNIYAKLGVSNRMQAVQTARDRGFLADPPTPVPNKPSNKPSADSPG